MQKFESLLSINVLNVSTESQFTILSLNMSYAVLTKKEFLYCSDLAVIGLKHWLLLYINLSTMFFSTKSFSFFLSLYTAICPQGHSR